MRQWQATCNRCSATLTPDAPCEHLWLDEHGHVYKVHPSHQYEPEPEVVAKVVTVTTKGYQRPNVALTPPADTETASEAQP